ncbi:MAG: TIGR01906 family membrane protein, partial [Anaerolineae bacterium]
IWVSVPAAMIALPLYILVTPGYVDWQYSRPSFPPSDRFNNSERIRLSDVIVNYLRGKASLQQMADMRTDQGDIAMRDAEVQHIADVKRVMDGFFVVQPIASTLLVLCIVLLILIAGRKPAGQALRSGVWITLVLLGFVIVSAAANFDVFFDRFHRIFFTGESWLFYYEDTLIQLYPLPLWMSAVWHIGIMIALELGLLYGLSFIIQGKRRQALPG